MSKKDRCLFESESQKTLRKANEELQAKLEDSERYLKGSHTKIDRLEKAQTERDLAMIAVGYLPLRNIFDVQVSTEYSGYNGGVIKFVIEVRTMDNSTATAISESLRKFRG